MNAELREHVTSTAFNLSLSVRQMGLLVSLHHFGEKWGVVDGDSKVKRVTATLRFFSPSINTARALADRGLIDFTKVTEGNKVPGTQWELTRAGELVVELLKESGLYQETVSRLQLDREAS